MKEFFDTHRKVILAIVVGFGVLLLLPFDVGYSVKTSGKILPAREWVVARGTDGRLISTLVDYKRGLKENYAVTQFERGDAVTFRFREQVASGRSISAGDTVGAIRSNNFEREYTNLVGSLAQAQATLDLLTAGEKSSVVEEARRNLDLAQKEAEEQARVFERMQGLQTENLVAREDFELAQSEKELRDIKVLIAQAQLENVQTGAKPQEVELIKTRIQVLQKEVATMKLRLAQYTLVTPVSGVVQTSSGDTMLVVRDTTELLLKMPIQWRQRAYVAPNQIIHLNAPDLNNEPAGKLLNIEKTVYRVAGKSMLLATAIIEDYHADLAPGLVLKCAIICEPIKPREYLWRFLKALL